MTRWLWDKIIILHQNPYHSKLNSEHSGCEINVLKFKKESMGREECFEHFYSVAPNGKKTPKITDWWTNSLFSMNVNKTELLKWVWVVKLESCVQKNNIECNNWE